MDNPSGRLLPAEKVEQLVLPKRLMAAFPISHLRAFKLVWVTLESAVRFWDLEFTRFFINI